MGKINVEFYDLPNGTEPMREFMNGLEPKMKAKMLRTIKLLADNGTELREPISKPLGDGIFELRVQVGNNITRALYFFFIGNKAILTHGFIKKTQATPPGEIEKAKRYRKEYLERWHET